MRYDLDGTSDSTGAESQLQPATASVGSSAVPMDAHGAYRRRIVRAFGTLAVFGVAALLFAINFRVVVVQGHSMEPTYHDGQRVLMTTNYWLFGPVRRGDVVVIRVPGGALLIKRVVALEGEEIPRQYWGLWALMNGTRVPKGYIYVVGDNLGQSDDSRQRGPFPLAWVQGKVVGGYREVP